MIQPIQFIIADSFTDSLYQPNGNEDPNPSFAWVTGNPHKT
jgi:hypothetical protein